MGNVSEVVKVAQELNRKDSTPFTFTQEKVAGR